MLRCPLVTGENTELFLLVNEENRVLCQLGEIRPTFPRITLLDSGLQLDNPEIHDGKKQPLIIESHHG